jgi:uncharacterized protein (TIGR01777 family)
MRILISGSTGLVGTALVESLVQKGHSVARLVRHATALKGKDATPADTIAWDPATGELDAARAEGADAVVHLAGASIAGGRWNAARKELLRTSRIEATRHLVGALAKLRRPPRVMLAASAIGYYGTRGDETLTEASASGRDFLAGLCREWEAEAARASGFGARVVNLRFGIVLAKQGGALPRMAMPIKFGVGGRLGNGRQWMSWVALAEGVRIVEFALATETVAGPINVVAPNPKRNSEFTNILAKTLHRPALFPAPEFALRIALGKMADALLLVSQRVQPSKLIAAGYSFAQPNLAGALEDLYRN